jgi:hypothetical protein
LGDNIEAFVTGENIFGCAGWYRQTEFHGLLTSYAIDIADGFVYTHIAGFGYLSLRRENGQIGVNRYISIFLWEVQVGSNTNGAAFYLLQTGVIPIGLHDMYGSHIAERKTLCAGTCNTEDTTELSLFVIGITGI